MIDPIPSGTRDVLPDEMRELRAITEKVRAVFDARGYGEVATPALEYETTLARGDAAAAEPAYRLFDEQGNVLVLRSDMTIPIARVVATRYASSSPPLRFCYFAHAYRSVRPSRGQAREMLQAGIELVGAPGPEGTVEAIELLCEVLDAVGLDGYRVGLGDASLYPALLDALGVPAGARAPILHELVTRDFVGLEREIEALRLGDEAAGVLLHVPQLRGGVEVLDRLEGPAAEVVGRLRVLQERLTPRAGERVIFDLGLSRSLGYYTGAIFEVYDGALGVPLGGGGRYDDLLGAVRAGAAGGGVGARMWNGCTLRSWAKGSAANDGPERADDRRASRRAHGGDAGSARRPRRRHLRGARQRPPPAVRRGRDRHDAALRRADLRRGGRRRPRHHRQGRPGRAGRARGLRARRPRLRALRDGVRDRRGRRPRRRGAAPARGHARGDEVPRIAARYFERTGRQAEIVEVKGSVELAPLTGLVEGIVDLTATGTTLRENGLVVREEIWASTARLIANPVAHKLKAAEIDEILARIRDAA